MSDDEDDLTTVELRRQKSGSSRRQSHLPTQSEIHVLRLNFNEKQNALHQRLLKGERGTAKGTDISSNSSPLKSTTTTTNGGDLHSAMQQLIEGVALVEEKGSKHKSSKRTREAHPNLLKGDQKWSTNNADQQHHLKKHKDGGLLDGLVPLKRNSFLRNSWNVIVRQSFRLKHSRSLDPSSIRNHNNNNSSNNSNSASNSKKVATKEAAAEDGASSSSWPAIGSGSGGKGKSSHKNGQTTTSDSEFLGPSHHRISFHSLRGKKSHHKRNGSSSSYFSNR